MVNGSPLRAATSWIRRQLPLGLAAALVVLTMTPAARALEDCFECHGLRGLATPGHALWMKPDGTSGGPHAKLVCSDCHKGVEVYPHDTPRVRCDLPCHVPGKTHESQARAEQRGAHSRLGALPCLGCHAEDKAFRGRDSDAVCLRCHRNVNRDRPVYPDSAGAFGFWAHRWVEEGKRAPRCVDCHGLHAVQPARVARNSCKSSGCHPNAGARFQELFDHRGNPDTGTWGGAGPAALVVIGLVFGALLLHVRRG